MMRIVREEVSFSHQPPEANGRTYMNAWKRKREKLKECIFKNNLHNLIEDFMHIIYSNESSLMLWGLSCV